MKILGLNCAFWHDPSAALLIDGRVAGAVEQERLTRVKHAPSDLCVEAARACLEIGGIQASDLDAVAYPWSVEALREHRWRYVRRSFTRRPSKAIGMVYRLRKKERKRMRKLWLALERLGVDRDRTLVRPVKHHLAHAASGAHFSEFDECAVASIDGEGEITTCLFAEARHGVIEPIHEVQRPDSLGLFYASITDYLGFDVNDGEYKVMGMASYGDPDRADLSDVVAFKNGDIRINTDFVWSPKNRRFENRTFGRRLVERFGPPRVGDQIDEPYIHIAAATQRLLEKASLHLIEYHLGPVLERTRKLCFVGGCAQNVVLNRRLMEHPLIDEIFVPPACGDAGTALGAASLVAFDHGERSEPIRHAYHGPSYSNDDVVRTLEGLKIPFERVEDAPSRAAQLLSQGEVVAWFQGSMEWGPRALGNRSILGNPGTRGTADDINARIKYRERWRPFCPSVLEEQALEFLGSKHPSPFMTLSYRIPDLWRTRTPDVIHVDGTARPQVVSVATNPRYHRLISEFQRRTGLPCVINTSLNRRGEPMVESPKDALAMFFGCGLEHLFLEDIYVTKRSR
jgi:carbamoyltransferase